MSFEFSQNTPSLAESSVDNWNILEKKLTDPESKLLCFTYLNVSQSDLNGNIVVTVAINATVWRQTVKVKDLEKTKNSISLACLSHFNIYSFDDFDISKLHTGCSFTGLLSNWLGVKASFSIYKSEKVEANKHTKNKSKNNHNDQNIPVHNVYEISLIVNSLQALPTKIASNLKDIVIQRELLASEYLNNSSNLANFVNFLCFQQNEQFIKLEEFKNKLQSQPPERIKNEFYGMNSKDLTIKMTKTVKAGLVKGTKIVQAPLKEKKKNLNDFNAVGMLHTHCQKRRLKLEFNFEELTNQEFKLTVLIEKNPVCTIKSGSKKLAKSEACTKILEDLDLKEKNHKIRQKPSIEAISDVIKAQRLHCDNKNELAEATHLLKSYAQYRKENYTIKIDDGVIVQDTDSSQNQESKSDLSSSSLLVQEFGKIVGEKLYTATLTLETISCIGQSHKKKDTKNIAAKNWINLFEKTNNITMKEFMNNVNRWSIQRKKQEKQRDGSGGYGGRFKNDRNGRNKRNYTEPSPFVYARYNPYKSKDADEKSRRFQVAWIDTKFDAD